MHRAGGQGDVQQIAGKFADAANGTVKDEDKPQGHLPQPGLGDGQVKEHLVVGVFGREEDLIQAGLCGSGLPANELAADLEIIGQAGDGSLASERLQSDGQFLAGGQQLGRTAVGNGLLQCQDRGSRITHVCFLLEKLAFHKHQFGGNRQFAIALFASECQGKCYPDLNHAGFRDPCGPGS